jgi:hypothetical protein
VVNHLGRRALLLGLSLGTVLCARPATARLVDEQLWNIGPGSSVSAMALLGDTLYLAGSFVSIGPSTGSGIVTDPLAGAETRRFPKVAGKVACAVSDEQGGWYIAGEFVGVGGLARTNLAHILASGRVDAWDPAPDGGIRTIELSRGILYVGGDFHRVAGASRRSVAAFHAATGRLTAWDPSPDGNVWVLYASRPVSHREACRNGDRVILVGGEFAFIGGQRRANLAAVDPSSGLATTWDPGPDYRVRALAQMEDTLFIGGNFYNVGGQVRPLLAAVNLESGRLLTWSASIQREPEWPYDGGPRVTALALRERVLYVAGAFTSLGGNARAGLGAVDAASGAATVWNPHSMGWGPDAPWEPYFDSMAIVGQTVYVGGEFFSLAGMDGGADGVRYAGAVDAVSGDAVAWNPRPNGQVETIAVGRGSMYLGGVFTSAWRWLPRTGLAAIDLTTGCATSWAPTTDGLVRTLLVRGGVAYIAGQFNAVNGQPRSNIAAVNAVSGAVTAWNPGSDGWIYAMAASGSAIYVGGWYSNIGGQARNNLAAINSSSGQALPWNPNPNDIVLSLATSGCTLYAGGFFSSAGGVGRPYAAAFDGTSAAVLPWAPAVDNLVDAIAIKDGQVYLGGHFSSVGGQQRGGLAAVDAATAALSPWMANVDQPVHALAVDDGAVYAGGEFGTVAGQAQSRVAAFDLHSGTLLPWAAGADATVLSMVSDGRRVCVGGAFRRLAGLPSCGVAMLPTAQPSDSGSRTLAVDPEAAGAVRFLRNEPNPARMHTTIRFDLLAAGSAIRVAVFDLQGRRVASRQLGQPQSMGAREIELSTSGWTPGCYLYRLEAGGQTATRKMIVVK